MFMCAPGVRSRHRQRSKKGQGVGRPRNASFGAAIDAASMYADRADGYSVAERSKNNRHSTNNQVTNDADTRLVVLVDRPTPAR